MSTSFLISAFLIATPLCYLFGALASHKARNPSPNLNFGFALAALGAALSTVLLSQLMGHSNPVSWISASPLRLCLLVLISFLGLIIVRYSAHYLAGEPGEKAYYRNLNLTLFAVSSAVISNHLLLLLAAWVTISLGLHRLLMFYPNRPRAALAAHKKFLFARLAEALLALAALCLYLEHGTWNISEILSAYPMQEATVYTHLAAMGLALTALIKCAQLPVHGWLIQVVEAPTPVSALLHAGIINLGGFLLLLFAPVISQSAIALWTLLIVAGLTTLLAGLIMMTRVSIKVRLAWSTCAQMGLMLVECALGLHELALLHLLAHSCYKAYAFLSSGAAVEKNVYAVLAPPASSSIKTWLVALTIAAGVVTPLALVVDTNNLLSPWLLLIVALTVVIAERSSQLHSGRLLLTAGIAISIAVLYYAQKTLIGFTVIHQNTASPSLAADVWVCSLIVLLAAGYLLLRNNTASPVRRRLWHVLYAGLYLDEWSTRITLKVWPTRLPVRPNPKSSPHPMLTREFLS